MPTPDRLSSAIQLLSIISMRDLIRLQAVACPPKQCLDETMYCDAIVQHGVVDGSQSHLSHHNAQTHHHLCSLLNLLLRRAVNPVRHEACGVVPSDAFARAVMNALIALGPACGDVGDTANGNQSSR